VGPEAVVVPRADDAARTSGARHFAQLTSPEQNVMPEEAGRSAVERHRQERMNSSDEEAQTTAVSETRAIELTEREIECVRSTAKGYSSPRIADRLALSVITADAHV